MARATKTGGDRELVAFLKAVGRNVRAVRERKEMTLEGAEAAGYPSWRHLQRVEAGQPFTMTTLFRVAKTLGVKPSELLKGY